MKLNFSFLKGKSAIWWVVGAAILFVVFYVIASKGSGGGSQQVVMGSSQPSDTAVAANAQLQAGQLALQAKALETQANIAGLNAAAQRDVALAEIGRDATLAETMAQVDVAKYVEASQSQVALANLSTQYQIARAQGEFSIDSAEIAAATQIKLRQSDANVVMKQLEANSQMFAQQTQALTQQALISAAVTAPKGVGLQRLQAITGQPITPSKSGGGFNFGAIISPASALFRKARND